MAKGRAIASMPNVVICNFLFYSPRRHLSQKLKALFTAPSRCCKHCWPQTPGSSKASGIRGGDSTVQRVKNMLIKKAIMSQAVPTTAIGFLSGSSPTRCLKQI